jgi:O-antigen/teichoic acid export membrane protein
MKLRSKLAGDAAIYTFSNFAVAGVPFLLMPILTRTLSPEAYGSVAMFSVVVSLLAVCVGLNVHGAVMVRFFDRGAFCMADYVTSCLLILAASTAVVGIGVFLFADLIERATALPLPWLLVAALVAAFQFVVQTQLVLWQASKQPRKYGILRVGQAGSDGLVSVVLVVVLALSWEGRLAGMAVAWGLAAAAALWLMAREGWVARAPSVACARDALRYGVPLLPHALGALLLGMADRFLVTNLMDVGSTGVYVVAVQIGMVLGIAADAFNRAFAPWLMETLQQASQERKLQIVQYTYFYFGAILTGAAVGTVLAPYLLGVLVGPRYQAVAPIVGYILFGNAFMGMYYMVTNYVFIARRTELLSGLSLVVGAATTALNWYLITHRGITGAAQAFMVGQALLFIGTWLVANHCYQMPWLHAVRQFKQA